MSNWEDFPTLDRGTNTSSVRVPTVYRKIESEELNLEKELLEQYNTAKQLLHDASFDETIPLNQKAQAVNSATAIIGALIKTQAELYSLERIKKIEAVLIATLRQFPDMQASFMTAYKEALDA